MSFDRLHARSLLVALAALLAAAGLAVVTPSPALAAPPTGLTPSAGAAVAGIPVLTWERSDATSKYDVQVSTSPAFTSTLVNITGTANHQYVPTRQLPSGATLYWRVRVTGSGEAWSDVADFGRSPIAGPTQLAPPDGASMQEPESPAVLAWVPVPGADGYQVQIGTDPNFVDQTATRTTESTSLVPGLQKPTTYYWRVRAEMSPGFFTQWSLRRSYVELGLRGPDGVGLSPPDDPDHNIQDVVLDWRPISGAKGYDLQVSTDSNFLTLEHTVSNVVGTRYSPPAGLHNDQYYWRIRPVDAAGNRLDWVDMPVWRFKRNWPDQPQLEYPAAGQNVGDPFYFQWTPVKHASSYTVHVTGVNHNATCTTVHTTLTKGHAAAGGCFPGSFGAYTWWVVANDEGIPSVELAAERRTFNYTTALVPQVAPASGATVSVPTMRWQAVQGAAKYKVTYTTGTTSRTVTTSALSHTPHSLSPGTYRWDVQPVRQTGELGAARTPGSQPTFVLAAPTSGTASQPDPDPVDAGASYRFPTLQWTPVAGADRYRLMARPQGGVGWSLIDDDFRFPAGEDTGSTYLTPGVYEWYVEAFDASNAFLSAGGIGTFTIRQLPATTFRAALTGNALTGNAGTPLDTCDATLPATCQNLRQTPVLGWDITDPEGFANVGYYMVKLSKDSELTNPVEKFPVAFAVHSTMWTPVVALEDSQAGSAYFWTVRPCTADGHCAPAQRADRAFNLQSRPQTLVSPPDGALVQDDVTLTWDDYLDSENRPDTGTSLQTKARIEAASYRVQTSSDPSFNTGTSTAVVEQTTFTAFASTLPEGTTYWRVQAVDGSGNNLAWSQVRSFVKQSPVTSLASPASGTEIPGDGTLTWTPLDFAASYVLEIYKSDDTVPQPANKVLTASPKQVSYVLDSLNPALGPYRWRVQRVDASGRPGAWSELRQFTVSRPVPTLVAPLPGALVEPSDALFTWEPVAGATSYRVERRRQGTTTVVDPQTTAALAWAPTAAIPGGDWEWRVTALDTASQALGQSSWTPFSVVDTPVATTPVGITGSGAVGTVLTLTPPTWNMPEGTVTTTYQWYRGTGAIADQTGLTYEVTAADVGKALTVRATAVRAGYKPGTSTSSAVTGVAGPAIAPSSPPTVGGVAAARETLTADPGSWPGSATFAYQWFVDGVAVAKETRKTYVVRTRDAGLPVQVRVTATTSGYQPGTATSGAVTVAKLSSSTTASLAANKIRQRDRGVVNVTVSMLDLGVTLGQVQVKEGSKVLATVGLQTGKNGALPIRLKRLKPGKHKLVVSYLGSVSTLGSKARTLTLTVVRG